jgi:hypothetical protein
MKSCCIHLSLLPFVAIPYGQQRPPASAVSQHSRTPANSVRRRRVAMRYVSSSYSVLRTATDWSFPRPLLPRFLVGSIRPGSVAMQVATIHEDQFRRLLTSIYYSRILLALLHAPRTGREISLALGGAPHRAEDGLRWLEHWQFAMKIGGKNVWDITALGLQEVEKRMSVPDIYQKSETEICDLVCAFDAQLAHANKMRDLLKYNIARILYDEGEALSARELNRIIGKEVIPDRLNKAVASLYSLKMIAEFERIRPGCRTVMVYRLAERGFRCLSTLNKEQSVSCIYAALSASRDITGNMADKPARANHGKHVAGS